jgi:predicted RNA-binding protein with PUA-like domain
MIAVGDRVLFYHSSTKAPGIAGVAEVVRAGHPDASASDPKSPYYDAKGDPGAPTWYQVTIRGLQGVDPPLTLDHLRTVPGLAKMELLRKGSRLSVQPVRLDEWTIIQRLIQPGTKRKKG